MRIVSFFSAKGGTGKTTFNLLFASYFKFHLGLRVLFLDSDGPYSPNYRQCSSYGYRYMDRLYNTQREKVQQISVKHTMKVLGGRIGLVISQYHWLWVAERCNMQHESASRHTSASAL